MSYYKLRKVEDDRYLIIPKEFFDGDDAVAEITLCNDGLTPKQLRTIVKALPKNEKLYSKGVI